MTTYHVWLTGCDVPEVVRAHEVEVCEGELRFMVRVPERSVLTGLWVTAPGSYRIFYPHEWHRWAVVHDEADHAHL